MVFCVSSILKRAKRKAENTGSMKAMQGNRSKPSRAISGWGARHISQCMMNPGATPNETTSESESKSAPMGEWALRSRAEKPSKKSKSPATKTMMAALTGMSWARKRTDRQPETRLPQVMALGMCCLRFMALGFVRCKGSLFCAWKREKPYFCRKIGKQPCSTNIIRYIKLQKL